jgi:hypothetical protein
VFAELLTAMYRSWDFAVSEPTASWISTWRGSVVDYFMMRGMTQDMAANAADAIGRDDYSQFRAIASHENDA